MQAQKTVTIVNKAGLHARASTRFVQTANKYKCNVIVRKEGQDVNGKSIMGVLLLVASQGSDITISCDGDDASQCIGALSDLVQAGFGED